MHKAVRLRITDTYQCSVSQALYYVERALCDTPRLFWPALCGAGR